MKLSVISKFDERYNKECLKEIAKQLNEKLLFILPENDGTPDTKIDLVCGEVVKGSAKLEDDQIRYEAKILGTDCGRAVKQILQSNPETVSLGLACIGMVKDDKIDHNNLTVVKGYLGESDNSNILEIE
jgi:hypothetical protein